MPGSAFGPAPYYFEAIAAASIHRGIDPTDRDANAIQERKMRLAPRLTLALHKQHEGYLPPGLRGPDHDVGCAAASLDQQSTKLNDDQRNSPRPSKLTNDQGNDEEEALNEKRKTILSRRGRDRRRRLLCCAGAARRAGRDRQRRHWRRRHRRERPRGRRVGDRRDE